MQVKLATKSFKTFSFALIVSPRALSPFSIDSMLSLFKRFLTSSDIRTGFNPSSFIRLVRLLYSLVALLIAFLMFVLFAASVRLRSLSSSFFLSTYITIPIIPPTITRHPITIPAMAPPPSLVCFNASPEVCFSNLFELVCLSVCELNLFGTFPLSPFSNDSIVLLSYVKLFH